MTKIKIIAVSLFCLFTLLANAQYKSQPTHFSGHIIGRFPGNKIDSIHCILRKSIFAIHGDGETVDWSVPIDVNGNFKINLGMLKTPARLYLVVAETHGLPEFLVNPGDDVYLEINVPENIGENEDLKYNDILFRGEGSVRLQCEMELRKPNLDQVFAGTKMSKTNFSIDQTLNITDSELNVQFNILNKYKKRMRSIDYELLKADVIGKVLSLNLNIVHIKLNRSKQYPFELFKADFSKFSKYFRKYQVQNSLIVSYSKSYMELLLRKEEVALAIEKHCNVYEFMDWYNWLKTTYTGLLREKLISYYLISKDTRDGGGAFIPVINEEQYKGALENAITLVKDSELKSKLVKRLRLTKGALAYNFNFPLDSTNKHVQLSDLRGKVVLLDRWSYSCSPCWHFASTFHQKIYPLLKGNPDFAYVSIMAGGSSMEDYLRRLRGLNNDNKPWPDAGMTSPDYINLRGIEDGLKEAERLDNYYNVTAVPFILLIDKKGKIYSSTIPFFENADSPNVQKLTDLIKQALAEKN